MSVTDFIHQHMEAETYPALILNTPVPPGTDVDQLTMVLPPWLVKLMPQDFLESVSALIDLPPHENRVHVLKNSFKDTDQKALQMEVSRLVSIDWVSISTLIDICVFKQVRCTAYRMALVAAVEDIYSKRRVTMRDCVHVMSDLLEYLQFDYEKMIKEMRSMLTALSEDLLTPFDKSRLSVNHADTDHAKRRKLHLLDGGIELFEDYACLVANITFKVNDGKHLVHMLLVNNSSFEKFLYRKLYRNSEMPIVIVYNSQHPEAFDEHRERFVYSPDATGTGTKKGIITRKSLKSNTIAEWHKILDPEWFEKSFPFLLNDDIDPHRCAACIKCDAVKIKKFYYTVDDTYKKNYLDLRMYEYERDGVPVYDIDPELFPTTKPDEAAVVYIANRAHLHAQDPTGFNSTVEMGLFQEFHDISKEFQKLDRYSAAMPSDFIDLYHTRIVPFVNTLAQECTRDT